MEKQQEIRNFQGKKMPVDVILLLDVSRSRSRTSSGRTSSSDRPRLPVPLCIAAGAITRSGRSLRVSRRQTRRLLRSRWAGRQSGLR